MTAIEPTLIIASALVLLAVVASKVSSRLGIPALVFFIGVGMLAGTDGVGRIDFTDFELAQNLGIVALAYILFDGGFSTSWRQIRPLLAPGLGLATIGVGVTAAVTGGIAAVALDLPWTTGLLLGAIVSSTDAAAVFSVLGARSAGLRGEVTPLLELESGTNDPMAAFLTIGLIELITVPGTGGLSLIALFAEQMSIGAVVGLAAGWLAVRVVNGSRLEYEGLYPVISLAVVLLTYGVAAQLGGSGFLAVYLAGIVMSNSDLLHRRSLQRIHDAAAWLCQIGMFLVLGLLVLPSQLGEVALPALIVAASLVLLARPLAVMTTLLFSRFSIAERAMISWVGLRGAVPIILATFPLVAGVESAPLLFDVVFFAVLISVLIQGTTIPAVARLLGVDETSSAPTSPPLEAVDAGQGGARLHTMIIQPDAPAAGRTLVELHLPTGTLIVLVQRHGAYVVPEGRTELLAGDSVMVLAAPEELEQVRHALAPGRR